VAPPVDLGVGRGLPDEVAVRGLDLERKPEEIGGGRGAGSLEMSRNRWWRPGKEERKEPTAASRKGDP
jgi:hypothetical protein